MALQANWWMGYSWQQIVTPGQRHPKPPSALMKRTCSGKACETWVQKCRMALMLGGQSGPCVVWLWSSPYAREQALSSTAAVIRSLGHFRGEVSSGNMEFGSCLSALMLAPGLAGLRLEPDCNCPSYFCNEEYMQSQAESISEEMNYQPNIDYFILRDVIQSTQLLSHSATFNVY